MGKALFSCDECPKAFSRKGDLTRHLNLHLNIRPYKCNQCGKDFSQFSGLKTHKNTHDGSKPHACGYPGCGAVFGDPSSCARHRKETHRRVGGYCCPVGQCGSKIKRRSAFAQHLWRKHGIDPDTVDLEAFAPPLLPAPALSPSRPIIKVVSSPASSVQSIAEEFKEQFCGFGPELVLVHEPRMHRSTSWSTTTSCDSPSLAEHSMEPCADFFGVDLPLPDTAVPSLDISDLDYQSYSPYSSPASTPISTPPSEYMDESPHPTPTLGIYTEPGPYDFPDRGFPSTPFFAFDNAKIPSSDLSLFDFSAINWVQACN